MAKKLQAIRGFRDLYPQDKIIQNYIFNKLKETAAVFGFEEYDGPILEPIEIYLDKTSEELINQQTFQIKDKKNKTLVLRPEMTPSLARLIAQKEQQLIFPLRLFNLGLRLRYETPQKGREREFYQADFDILGISNILADAEILAIAVNIFLNFGAKEKDFIVYVNSREAMRQALTKLGVDEKLTKDVISIIDKKEKVSKETFVKMLTNLKTKTGGDLSFSIDKITDFLENPSGYENYFKDLLSILKMYNLNHYIKINPSIVRGLDYYTGLVFEVKEKGAMSRSLLGGGRYDNLVANLGASRNIPGVGFATSDVVLWEFLKAKNLLPQINPKPTKVLITVFPNEYSALTKSIEISNFLRQNNIATEVYPEADKKLDKQLKYADKNKIPYVVIIGPEEIKNNTVKIKNMKTAKQQILKSKELFSSSPFV